VLSIGRTVLQRLPATSGSEIRYTRLRAVRPLRLAGGTGTAYVYTDSAGTSQFRVLYRSRARAHASRLPADRVPGEFDSAVRLVGHNRRVGCRRRRRPKGMAEFDQSPGRHGHHERAVGRADDNRGGHRGRTDLSDWFGTLDFPPIPAGACADDLTFALRAPTWATESSRMARRPGSGPERLDARQRTGDSRRAVVRHSAAPSTRQARTSQRQSLRGY